MSYLVSVYTLKCASCYFYYYYDIARVNHRLYDYLRHALAKVGSWILVGWVERANSTYRFKVGHNLLVVILLSYSSSSRVGLNNPNCPGMNYRALHILVIILC
jgi:hypothetical protein